MPVGDLPLYMLLAEQGDICYLDQVMATYRVHGQGRWSGLSNVAKAQRDLENFQAIATRYAETNGRSVEVRSIVCRFALAAEYYLAGEQSRAEKDLGPLLERLPKAIDHVIGETVWRAARTAREGQIEVASDLVSWMADALKPTGYEWTRRLLAQWNATRAFEAHQSNDPATVRESVWQAWRHDWALIRNLGLVSIMADATLGSQLADQLRRVYRTFS
jgi:hypothetical protein